MKNFDLYSELKALGFERSADVFNRDNLEKSYEKEHFNEFYGSSFKTYFKIRAIFSEDHSVVTVLYYEGGKSPYKTKTHLNEKRALNAIRETARHKDFEI